MPKSQNQKLKILYVLEALKKTDEYNPISVGELVDYLASNGIKAERKSVYDDLDALERFGYDIIRKNGKNGGVYLGAREFELPEIKLLVDAVQSSKFISESKSGRLIEKLAKLAGGDQAAILKRQVTYYGKVKTRNENVFISIDKIHTAMAENRMISFLYYAYIVEDGKIKKVCRHEGKKYCASPWTLTWDNEFYYMLAYDESSEMIKHFRVDKMADISILHKERRGKEAFGSSGISGYTNSVFSMFGGADENVRISCDNSLIGAVVDRYGSDLAILKESDERFIFTAKVKVSPQFFAWVFSFGKGMKILSPENVVEQMKAYLKETSQIYFDSFIF